MLFFSEPFNNSSWITENFVFMSPASFVGLVNLPFECPLPKLCVLHNSISASAKYLCTRVFSYPSIQGQCHTLKSKVIPVSTVKWTWSSYRQTPSVMLYESKTLKCNWNILYLNLCTLSLDEKECTLLKTSNTPWLYFQYLVWKVCA